jgi:hypothetical protein
MLKLNIPISNIKNIRRPFIYRATFAKTPTRRFEAVIRRMHFQIYSGIGHRVELLGSKVTKLWKGHSNGMGTMKLTAHRNKDNTVNRRAYSFRLAPPQGHHM